MHDPKLSAAVAHHQMLLSESLVDKLPNNQHFRHLSSDHLDNFHHRHSKTVALPRTSFSSSSSILYPEDILDSRSQGRLLPLCHRLKDSGSTSEMLLYPGYESAFSEVAARYRYSDLAHARRFYELLYGDRSAITLPVSTSVMSRQLSVGNDYLLPRQSGSRHSSDVLKDISAASTSLALKLPSLSSSPTRIADALSLSPLHVTTTVSSSSPLSSESSPSPLRRSSVSPDSRWSDTNYHHQVMTRPNLTSSELSLYEERALHGDLTFPPTALPPSLTFPPPLWQPSSSMAVYGLIPPPLMCVYTPQSIPIESRANPGHFLDHYISSSSSNLAHHHLHHHLHRHHFVKDSFYNGNAPSSTSDSRASPGKELPTKLLKQDRIRDRQELSGALVADREHTERLNNVKKSASTQTQFSSFSCENLPPPPYYTTHDTLSRDKLHSSTSPGQGYASHLTPPRLPPSFLQYSHTIPSYHSPLNAPSSLPAPPPPPHSFHPNLLLSHTSPKSLSSRHVLGRSSPSPPATPTLPPPPLPQPRKCSPPTHQPLPTYSNASQSCSPAPPPPPQYPSHTRVQIDVQHAPLNLSLSSTPPVPSIISQSRPSPSVNPTSPIDSDSYRGGAMSEESANHRHSSDKIGSNHETAAQVSDEAIEEHFRRSLGKCYSEPSPPKKVAVHVTEKICSVDDHFARALGDQMWTEIKARSEPPPLDSLPGSVDAHFAKALGAAMWKKLKAENKLTDDVSSINQAQPQPQSSEEQPTRQKSAPPSPLQKSLVT